MLFSVLISCYKKDKPEELAIALRSIWDEQTVKPAEIVIVKDGALTPDLDAVIEEFKQRAPVNIVPLAENKGLGLALAEGVAHCSYDYIARMDSDDISVPDRFEKQVSFLEKHPEVAICGGMIQEFSGTPDNITGKRLLPQKNTEIFNFLKKRNPFNHMTVMYKKQAVLDAGNYQHILGYEDYWLWARVLAAGEQGENLSDILVYVRAGDNMLQRRRGYAFFKAEIDMALKLKQISILNWLEVVRNIMLRGGIRLLPTLVLRMVYCKLRG